MELFMKVILKIIKSMGKANLLGRKVQSMKEALSEINSKGQANTNGQMAKHTKDNGWKAKCMEKEFTYGQMASGMYPLPPEGSINICDLNLSIQI